MASGWIGWDWGSVPAWTGTLLTSGSLLIGALAFRRSVRDKERDQASKISAWVSENPSGQRTLWIANRSDAAIHMVTIQPFEAPRFEFAELAAGDSKRRTLRGYDKAVLTRKAEFRSGVSAVQWRVQLKQLANEPAPEMTFRDAMGRWWRRDARGNVRRTRPRQPVTTSFALYLLGFNVAVLYYDPEAREWRLGRESEPPDGGIGRLLHNAASLVFRQLAKLRARKRSSDAYLTHTAGDADT